MISPTFISDNSTYFENLMRHRFTYDVSRLLLLRDPPLMMNVSRAEIDDAGVDIVMTVGRVTRQIQMKALAKEKTSNPYAIAESLLKMPQGCVIWICYDRESLEPSRFHLFDAGLKGLDAKALASIPQATKKKNGVKIPRKGYRHIRIKDAQHQALSLERIVAVLFDPA